MATKEERAAFERMVELAVCRLSPEQLVDCARSEATRDAIRDGMRGRLEKAEDGSNADYLGRVAQDLRRIIAKGTPEELATIGFTFSLGILASRLVSNRMAMDYGEAMARGLLLACVDMPTTEEEAADAGASVH